MPMLEGAETTSGLNAADYHAPHTVEDVTNRNVQTVVRLEETAKANRDRTDRMADAIARFCGSFTCVWVHLIWFGGWVVINVLPGVPHFDPFPFTFLTRSFHWKRFFFQLSFSSARTMKRDSANDEISWTYRLTY